MALGQFLLSEYGLNALVVAIILLGGYFFSKTFAELFQCRRISKLPLVGGHLGGKKERKDEWLKNARKLYQQGYARFKDRTYRLTSRETDWVVIPYTSLDDLKHLPNNHLNLNKEVHERTESKYTGMDRVNKDFLIHMVRSDLTRNLSTINATLAIAINNRIDDELGFCKEWTQMTIFPKMLKSISIIAGEVYVGHEIAHDERYWNNSITTIQDFFKAVSAVKRWPGPLKWVVKYVSPEVKTLQAHLTTMRELIVPTIRARKGAQKRGEAIPEDMLTWMIAKASEWDQSDDVVAEAQLELSAVTIFTTTNMLVASLYELAIRPELADELRKEIESVTNENGELNVRALWQMRLADSFLRETARMNPQAPARFQRYVEKPLILNDGTYIPAGVYIEAPHEPVQMDPAVFPEPHVFDPHRFLKLRGGTAQDPNNYENKELYQFVTATKENLTFGWGPHTCPGRFWAANALKLMLARILTQYDIRMPGGSQAKPPMVCHGLHQQPNPTGLVEFKNRESVEA